MEDVVPGGEPAIESAEARAARVEQLLRQAHIQRMRGQWVPAETLCRKALELTPDDVMGMELLGDLLLEKGSYREAAELFRKAFESAPQKVSLEEKIARTALLIGEEEQERLAAQMLLNNPSRKSERKRNATIATLFSLLCPGVGQLFLGQRVKGGILLTVGLLALVFGSGELVKLMVVFSGGGLPRGESINQFLAALGILGVLVWLYSLLDASAQAGRNLKTVDG